MAPPALVGSTNTLPPRSSLMNAVVATSGSSRSARAATARVAAAASSSGTRPSTGTNDVQALRPARLHRAREPDIGQRLADETGRGHAGVERRARAAGRGPARDGSTRSVLVDRAPASGGTRRRAGWRTTAACAGRRRARTPRRAWRSRAQDARSRPSRACTSGTFFCMNGCWPRWTRITESGRSSSSGRIRSRDGVEVVDEVALGGVGAVEQRWSRLVSATPSRVSVCGFLAHQLVMSFRANRQRASDPNTVA